MWTDNDPLGCPSRLNVGETCNVTDSSSTAPHNRISGTIISAVFCIPHKVTFSHQNGWELTSRSGYSALFGSLSYLSSSTNSWDHKTVGWTGEIQVSRSKTQASSIAGKPSTVEVADQRNAPRSASQGEEITIPAIHQQVLEDKLKEVDILPVWLVDECDLAAGATRFRDQTRWRRYAEQELYTMLHYSQRDATDGRREKHWWADYCRMNELFAARIAEIYRPQDIIWIHDYQLFLLPQLLRKRLPQANIGFFLHTSFPSSEYIRCLSQRRDILEGILGANLVGFQSLGFLKHFTSCCSRVLRLDTSDAGVIANGTNVAVGVMPIGIDVASTHLAVHESELVNEKVRGLRELYTGKKIIVGRDRLDSVKGVVQKLQAFEMFLDRYPEWRGRVVLIQVTSPPNLDTQNEDVVNKVAIKISELVSRINGAYGTLSFAPVQHYPQYLSREEYFALLRVADVGLITSVRDGMNTTSMQYVISQKDNHGPLILSEFSGTSSSLTGALCVNPWNLGEVAECIHRALRMPREEREIQHREVYRQTTTQTVENWNAKFLEKLVSTTPSPGSANTTPVLDMERVTRLFNRAERRLFMFDYDGTLTPIVSDPRAAVPSDRLVQCISRLAADPRNAVWIISGRDQDFLEEWLGDIPGLGLSAEHGSFIKRPEALSWEDVTEKADLSWQMPVMDVLQQFTEQTPGAVIERKKVALTWHYRNADPDYGRHQSRRCYEVLQEEITKKFDVEVITGKANLEVRPLFVNKGEIAKRLIGQDASKRVIEPPDFLLCLGDDHTDEDMFRALESSSLAKETVFTCSVGPDAKPTSALWHLPDPTDVLSILELLTEAGDNVKQQQA